MNDASPPIAPKIKQTLYQLGFERTDNYAWLKDDNWQAVLANPDCLKPDIRSYLEQENAYTEQYMKSTLPLQEQLFMEMKNRLSSRENSLELQDGPWIYFSRFEPNSEYRKYYRKPRSNPQSNPQETLLLDPNSIAHDHKYYKTGSVMHSPDHRYLAYAEDIQGSEIWQIRIKDLENNRYLPQTITPSTGEFTFSPCSHYLFWIYRDSQGRPTRILRHDLKTTINTVIYEEQDPGFFLSIRKSLSNQWIFITAHDHDTNETWLIPKDKPESQPLCMMHRRKGILYDVTDWQGDFIIKTNCDNAHNFKLMRLSIDQALANHEFSREYWHPWIEHHPENYIMDVMDYQNHLIRLERRNVNPCIVITHTDNREDVLTGDEEAHVLSLDAILDNHTDWLHYSYQSPTTPRHWYRHNLSTGQKEILKIQEIPSGHNPRDYETKRLWATARDGEKIPITLTYHRNTKLDGNTPVLLYGYGSYGYAIDPVFSITALNYLNHGWIYAIAHVRGGSEKGWNWFLEGRKFKKINSFTDFITCADFLIEQNYTNPKRIVADGRSAGGMVMGYVANERPDLFAGIIAGVPFVDVLNTMSDTSLPLTPPEWPEWGNPIEDEKAYQYIASYSPYDNIKKQAYPAILAIGGLTDPRVTYWEPSKWIAKLREHNQSSSPLLLKIDMNSGHRGTAGRYSSLKESAFIQAFAFSII